MVNRATASSDHVMSRKMESAAMVTPPRTDAQEPSEGSGKKKHLSSLLGKSLRKAFQRGSGSSDSVTMDTTQSTTPTPPAGIRPPPRTASSSSSNKNNSNNNNNTSNANGAPQKKEVAVVPPPMYNKRRPSPKPLQSSIPNHRFSADGFCRQVDGYDGQIITVEGREEYELGNFLGGGVAGVVYEALQLFPDAKSSSSSSLYPSKLSPPPAEELQVAMKILNPLNFRLLPPSSFVSSDSNTKDNNPNLIVLEKGILPEKSQQPLRQEHVWWLIHPNSRNLRNLKGTPATKTNNKTSLAPPPPLDRGAPNRGIKLSVIACYWDTRMGQLRELPLKKCIEMWGMVPFSCSEEEFEKKMDEMEKFSSSTAAPQDFSAKSSSNVVLASLAMANTKKVVYCEAANAYICIPVVPPKYLRWLRQRRAATREIRNMMKIGRHKNVVHLYEVLELIQDTKSTMFLVLELVRGGELFDLISSQKENNKSSMNNKKVDGDDSVEDEQKVFWGGEKQMKEFFRELVSGIAYCHANGIAHRDLKPENLLVHTGPKGEKTLKIADFGLSATFALASNNAHGSTGSNDIPGCAGLWGTWLTQSPLYRSSSGAANRDAGGEVNSLRGDSLPLQQQEATRTTTPTSNFISEFFTTPARVALALLTCGDASTVGYTDMVNEEAFLSNNTPSPLRRMTSVVGSPHYVAPEIVSQAVSEDEDDGSSKTSWQSLKLKSIEAAQNRKNNSCDNEVIIKAGYDGTKADVWSAGVILYAMLFRSLPFGDDLFRCPRFIAFNKWYNDARCNSNSRRARGVTALDPFYTDEDEDAMLGPPWFFPQKTSRESRDLIIAMLNPDPLERLSIEMVSKHPWLSPPPL